MAIDRTLYYYPTKDGAFLKLTKADATRRGLSGGREHMDEKAPIADGGKAPKETETKKVEEPTGETAETKTKKTSSSSTRRKAK